MDIHLNAGETIYQGLDRESVIKMLGFIRALDGRGGDALKRVSLVKIYYLIPRLTKHPVVAVPDRNVHKVVLFDIDETLREINNGLKTDPQPATVDGVLHPQLPA